MKMPQSPPDLKTVLYGEPQLFERILPLLGHTPKQYYHWDQLRHRSPPDGYTVQEWWAAIKIGRLHRTPLPLSSSKEAPFSYLITDAVTEQLHHIDMGAGGRIGMLEPVTNPQTRDQYLVSSLIHEAITSSQLEGAVTTRAVAKEMLRTGRAPRDKSEHMILNNYLTMKRIIDLKDQALTPELVFDIHRRVTENALDQEDASGRFRTSADHVTVEDDTGEIFHVPPPAEELPERLRTMCQFANGTGSGKFVHPVIRAVILHFWLAYDHPFVDGNGRTARALFYWAMLRNGYWLFEYISISDILLKSPTSYYRAFLYTETDDNDLTYFLIHQVEVIQKAIANLHDYIGRKSTEVQESEQMLRAWPGLNHRQISLITHALRHPGNTYTVEGHQNSHATVYETARRDLMKLADSGLLTSAKRGRTFIYSAAPDLAVKLKVGPAS